MQQEEQEQEEHPGRRSMPQPLAVQPAPQEPGGSSTIMSGSVSWLTSEVISGRSFLAALGNGEYAMADYEVLANSGGGGGSSSYRLVLRSVPIKVNACAGPGRAGHACCHCNHNAGSPWE